MLVNVKKLYPPRGKRLIAISDIHAHLNYLDALLEKIRFSDDDILFIVGDMVERGPSSLGTLRRAMELSARGNTHVLPGNMDLWSLSYVTGDNGHTGKNVYEYAQGLMSWCGGNLFYEMCCEAGIAFREDMDIPAAQALLKEKFRPEIDFINSLPAFIETPDYIFVHGGFPGGKPEKYKYQDVRPFLKNDAFIGQGHSFDKYVIVGHWPAMLYRSDVAASSPYIARDQKIVDIDGGVGLKLDAQLNALFLPNGGENDDFSWESYDDLPRLRALDAQSPSGTCVNIRWVDNAVDVLSVCAADNFAHVRHTSTGREFDVPVSVLYDYTPGETHCRCNDYTDFRMSVAPGDELRLIMETPRGCMVKKGDFSGWYDGRVQRI